MYSDATAAPAVENVDSGMPYASLDEDLSINTLQV